MLIDSRHLITLSLTSSFIIGVALHQLFGLISFQFTLVCICLYLFFLLTKIISRQLLSIALLVILSGGMYAIWFTPKPDSQNVSHYINTSYTGIKGTLITDPQQVEKDRLKIILSAEKLIKKAETLSVKGKILVYVKSPTKNISDLMMGDKVLLKSPLKFPPKPTSPGVFDYGHYLKIKGIDAVIYTQAHDVTCLKMISDSFYLQFLRQINSLKKSYMNQLKVYLPNDQLVLLGGMVFGDDAVAMYKETKIKFINSGLIHIVSASGFNLTVVSLGLVYILTFTGIVPYRLAICSGIFTMLLYSFLTGFPPSILRASLMLGFILVGKLINREMNTLRLLSIACAILVAINQNLLQDIGFQLSFLTTLGLILTVEPLVTKIIFLPQGLGSLITVPIVAQVWASPIICYHFNKLSTYSVLSNILVLPVVPIITVIGFISFGLFILFPWLGFLIHGVAIIISPLLKYTLWIADFFSNIEFSTLYIPAPSVFQCILLYLCLMFLLLMIKKTLTPLKVTMVSLLLIVCFLGLILIENPTFGKLNLAFLDVGQGDCIVIKSPKGKVALIDTGGAKFKNKSYAHQVIVPYLEHMGVRHVDLFMTTHPDKDHIHGAADILRDIPVHHYMDNGFSSDNLDHLEALQIIVSKGIPYQVVDRGDVIHLDSETTLTVLSPEYAAEFQDNSYNTADNNNSLVVMLRYKKFSALLTADAEADILNSFPENMTATVLKVPHHGSYNSVNTQFIKKVLPEVAVIQVGKNFYGHPHQDIIDILYRYNVKVYRNDLHGAIEITTNGRGYTVKTYKV